MTIPFEPTRSYIYNAARYELLPKIAEIARDFGDEPFLLRDITKRVLMEMYTQEQLGIHIKKAKSDATEKVSTIFGFYVPFLAENLRVFENAGGGQFKNFSLDEELAEADAVATDVASNDSGIIYAYSFPALIKGDTKFPNKPPRRKQRGIRSLDFRRSGFNPTFLFRFANPVGLKPDLRKTLRRKQRGINPKRLKVGLTTTGDADARVIQQCKQTCCFEYPQILKTWDVQRVAAVEDAIHPILKARGFKRNSPGTEWFDTTVAEVESIITFVQSNS